VRAWLPVIAWVAIIMLMATDLFSGNRTAQLLYDFVTWLFPNVGWDVIGPLHMYLRKAGHFIGYAILGVLAFRAWRAARESTPISWLNLAVRAVVVAVVVACADETLQAFMTARGGSMLDVLLDGTGASAAQVLLFLRSRRTTTPEA